MPTAGFEEFNKSALEKGEKTLANPAMPQPAACASSIPKLLRSGLAIFCYGFGLLSGGDLAPTHSAAIRLLPKWGLPVSPELQCVEGLTGCRDYFSSWQNADLSLDTK